MRGRIEIPANMIVIIISLMGVFMLVVLIFANIGSSAKILERNINRLNSIDATHIIHDCLKDGNDIILESFLTDNTKSNGKSDKNICELCGICEILIEAEVEDIERQFTWKFDYSNWKMFWSGFGEFITFWKKDPHTENMILVSILAENGEVRLGKLNVWV
jgi:hypothetical protein